MTKSGNLLRGVVAALMIAGLVACSENSSPSQALQDLIAKNDHKGLETWYMKEATHLRQRSKDMTVMTESYRKTQAAKTPSDVPARIILVQHCQTLSETYAKAAEEAEAMARAHRDMAGG